MVEIVDFGGSIPRAMIAVALLLLSSHRVGLWLFPSKHFNARDSHGIWIVQIALGLCVLAAISMLLGQFKLLSETGAFTLIIFGATLQLASHSSVVTRTTWSQFSNHFRPLNRKKLLLFASLIFISLGPALCIPDGWDELVYHHTIPHRWQNDGWASIYTDLPYSGFPSLAETLFWIMCPIENVVSFRLLTWSCWILALMAAHQIFRWRLSRLGALVFTASLAFSSTVLMVGQNCYVEPLQFLFYTSMLLITLSPRRRRGVVLNMVSAVAIGVLGAGAVSVKLTGISIAALALGWLLVDAMQHRFSASAIVKLLGFTIAFLAVCIPFYLRPFLLTGNPTYPYFAQYFTDDPATLASSQFHHQIGSNFGLRNMSGFILSPLIQAVEEIVYDGSFGFQLWMLLILCVVAASAFRRRLLDHRNIILGVGSIFLYLFWFLTAQQARFAIPLFLSITIAASYGMRKLKGSYKKTVYLVLICLTAVSFPYHCIGYYAATWAVVLRRIPASMHVAEGTKYGYLELLNFLNALPDGSRLAFLFEHRTFYVKHPVTIATPNFQPGPVTLFENSKDVDTYFQLVRSTGTTHLVIAKTPTGPDVSTDWLRDGKFIEYLVSEGVPSGKLVDVFETDWYVVYEVQPTVAKSGLPNADTPI